MTPCRSCHRPVVWVVTEAGRSMPMDPTPVPDGNLVKVGVVGGKRTVRTLKKGEDAPPGFGRYVSHFATCPHASGHRRS